jgi:hypothetical protein
MWSPKNSSSISLKELERQTDLLLRAMTDITRETACLKEIKDVSDELNSVANVFRQQIAVVNLMVNDIAVQKRNEGRNKGCNESHVSSKANNPKTSKDENHDDAEDTRANTSNRDRLDKKLQANTDYRNYVESYEDMEIMYKSTLAVLERRLGDIESLSAKAFAVYKDVGLHFMSLA